MNSRFLILIVLVLLLAGCSQNMEVVNSGERLEDSPKPVVDSNAAPLAQPGVAAEAAPGNEGPKIPPFVKAYFMHMWVEALYSTPGNKHPNPKWQSPLKDPENGRVWCTDCHISGQIDFSKIPKVRNPMVDGLEKDKEFMVDLMKKWVARLKNEQFIEFCEAAGDHATAKLYREQIQPDEQWHVHLGRTVLEKYANTPELQEQARKAVEAVLDLAVKIQNKQLKEMKVSHAPGC